MNTSAVSQLRFHIVETARGNDQRLRKVDARAAAPAATRLEIVPLNLEQELIGFGGAFTEASAYTLSQMSPDRRREALRAYFDPIRGSRYTLCRTHINSCDFALGNYAYGDVAGDTALQSFSVEHERQWLFPMIRDAQAASGNQVRLLASPWSPPAWMKTNGQMNNGGQLKPEFREAWAAYYAKYIHACRKEGIDIWGITVQNEPEAVQRWDSCIYTGEEERDFVRDFLGPTLHAEGLGHVKIIIWDHNKDRILPRAKAVLDDSNAARYVWGVGFHWYAGDHFEQLAETARQFPDKKLIATENCQENGVKLGSWELGERYAHSIIGDLNHGAVGWLDWNLVLDRQGGPNHVNNFCDAPIIADPETNELHYQNAYHYIGHFSRYLAPGARRMDVKISNPLVEATAWKNADGTIAVVVLNKSEERCCYALKAGGESVNVEMPARSIQTVVVSS